MTSWPVLVRRRVVAVVSGVAVDRALLLLAAMTFVVQLGVAVMLPLLPLFARQLGAEPFVLGLLTSAFAVTNAAGQLATGFLADRFPVRRLLAAGIGSYAVANFLIAGASNALGLVALRALAGIGGGSMLVGERLYLVQIADPARLAFANGILSAAGSAGAVAGPAIGGLLATIDLRIPFLVVGTTSLIATIAAWFLPRTARERTPRARSADERERTEPDEGGVATPPTAQPSQPVELHAEPPAVGRRGTTRARLLILFGSQVGMQAGFGGFITTFAPFATERLGWAAAEVGLVFALFGLGSILLGPWLARLADRYGRRNVAILSTIPVVAFGLVYLAELPRIVLYPVSIVAGGGLTAIFSAWYALLAEATDGGRRGRAFGSVTAFSNLGIIIGATVAAQAWERSGNVGLGLLVASISVVVSAALLALHPPDPPRMDGR